MYGDIHNVQYKERLVLFNHPFPVPCEVTLESCFRDRTETLVLGADCKQGIDEPFPWLDTKYKVSLTFLQSLPDKTRLIVYTRSDIVAHDDYIAEFRRLNVSINILYTSTNDDQNRITEPGAPSFKRRGQAIDKLRSLGIDCLLLSHEIPSPSSA